MACVLSHAHIHNREFKIQVHVVARTANRMDDVILDIFPNSVRQGTSLQREKKTVLYK